MGSLVGEAGLVRGDDGWDCVGKKDSWEVLGTMRLERMSDMLERRETASSCQWEKLVREEG